MYTVTQRPSAPVPLTEYDPSDPQRNPTTCSYFFAPIAHADFCPQKMAPSAPKAGNVNKIKFCPTSDKIGDISTTTTDALPFLQIGLSCSKVQNCTAQLYSCTGSPSFSNSSCFAADVVTLETGSGFVYSANPLGAESAKCPVSEATSYLSVSQSNNFWSSSSSTYTAMVQNGEDPLALFTISDGTSSCFKS